MLPGSAARLVPPIEGIVAGRLLAIPSVLLVVARDTSEAARLEGELGFFLSRDDDPEVLWREPTCQHY